MLSHRRDVFELREKTALLLLAVPSTSRILRSFAVWCQIVVKTQLKLLFVFFFLSYPGFR